MSKLALFLLLTACAGHDPLLAGVASTKVTAGRLELHPLFALPPFTDAPMPVYVVILNRGDVADTLLGAASPASGHVMLHGGGMSELNAVAVPAGDSLMLVPGQLHLMLDPPLPPLVRGDTVEVTLRFSHAGAVRLMVPVIDYVDVDVVH
jgi:hypothetical protein